MTPLRRVGARLAAVCLCCQLGSLALVPLALHLTARGTTQVDGCTCEHTAGVMCPMHHKPARGSNGCTLQAAGGFGIAMLATIIGATGVVPEPIASAAPSLSSIRLRLPDAHVTAERPVPPDPPPPRA